MTDAT